MYRAPSLARLVEAFPQVEEANLVKIRKLIQGGKPLAYADKLLDNHGVEHILDGRGNLIAIYSNSGDTYAPTIVYAVESGTYRLTTVGDFIETWERRHGPLP